MGSDGRIRWYTADPRGVIPLDQFHVPSSLRQVVRQKRFEIRVDNDFEQTMRNCMLARPEGTWINEDLIAAYVTLHRLGFAHSVEAYRDGGLVGGLYGIHIGSAFFGESMFSLPAQGGTNASKVCLVHLMQRLREAGFTLVDAQFHNPHLEQFGLSEIPLPEYLERLKSAITRECRWPF